MFYFEWEKHHRRLIGGSFLCGVAAMVVGFLLDGKDFFSNLIAEFAGITIGFCIAVLLIETVVGMRRTIVRSEKWKRMAKPFDAKLRKAIVELAASSFQLSGKARSTEEAMRLATWPYPDVTICSDLCRSLERAWLAPPVFPEVALDQADRIAKEAVAKLTEFRMVWAEVLKTLDTLLIITDDYDLLYSVNKVDRELDGGLSQLAERATGERRALLVRNSVISMHDAAIAAARTLALLTGRRDSLYPGNEVA